MKDENQAKAKRENAYNKRKKTHTMEDGTGNWRREIHNDDETGERKQIMKDETGGKINDNQTKVNGWRKATDINDNNGGQD